MAPDRLTPEQMLRQFHSAAGLPLPPVPTAMPELGSQTGRAKILAEEVAELSDAIDRGDIIEIADACADVVYAVVGTAVTYGVPFDDVLAEVHRSNMTKLIPPVRTNVDGKILKGSRYERPDIGRVLSRCVPKAAKTPCAGYMWIGQSFEYCDRCGFPYWEHTHESRSTGVPFASPEETLVPITAKQAAACKRKYAR